MANKTGPIAKTEIDFVRKYHETLSLAEMSRKLRRTEEAIRKIMIDSLRVAPDDDVTQKRVDESAIQKELTSSPEWKALKAEFMDDELQYFKHRFGKLMAQFSNELVTATEETQVFLLIKYEILMQRNLKDQKKTTGDISRLELILEELYAGVQDQTELSENERSYALNLENQLLTHRASKQSKSSEYEKLTSRHSALMKELKGTRDQRINKIENSKQTFLDVIKELQNEKIASRVGRHMELVNIATEKEKDRLSQLHTYEDGVVDQPLLTPENVV